MANPFQQRARQRKIIYLALIVALFTGSIMHRKFVVEKQAEDLQLREAVRGEVELTSSFVRLSLTGSRGLATTLLWATAIDRQTKHEWNELELLVGSISKLQPYFITPWVFQSWNLAFNVAVECDRPRDKYYFISRGLEFLAEGERRNQGTPAELHKPGQPQFPGHPEMRHYMGFYYQLKIGNSDEKNTMRCLLDLSCIDPIQRDPERFWGKDERGRPIVKREELARLCQNHPRLVRRLREGLGYESPTQIVKFLEANKDVPSRFKKTVSSDQKESELEEPRKQFPILPPAVPRSSGPEGPAWPNPKDYQMTSESVDVFLMSRTWYQYAQEPLPPPMKDPGVTFEENKQIQDLERLRKEKNINYRNAKTMAIQIFRSYPSRAQIYIAENLEAEGWFDDDGWAIKGWFDRGDDEQELQVGTETKHHAGPSWEEAYRMCREWGTQNGLYMSPAEFTELQRKAAQARVALKIREGDPLPSLRPELRKDLGESYDAHQKLFSNLTLRSMTNFDATLAVAEAEKDRETVLARKALYQAARYKKDQIEAIPLFEESWPLWVDVTLRYPQFMQISTVQEDIYDPMLKYMRLVQKQNLDLFRAVNLTMAQMAIAPHPNWPHPSGWSWPDWPYWDSVRAEGRPYFADPAWKSKNSLRAARGPLEMVVYYDGPQARQVRNYWAGLTSAASQLGQLGGAVPVLLPEYGLAGGLIERRDAPPEGWRYLMDTDVAASVRERYGLLRRDLQHAPPGMLPPDPKGPAPKAQER